MYHIEKNRKLEKTSKKKAKQTSIKKTCTAINGIQKPAEKEAPKPDAVFWN